MAQSKKHESGDRKETVSKVQPSTSDVRARDNSKKGAKVRPPSVATHHDLQNRVESKAPGSGVYCDERANRLSCTPPAPTQAAPKPVVKSEPTPEKIDKPEPVVAPAESEAKE